MIGILAETRLPREEWPVEWTWLGGTRVVARRRFEQWLAERTGSVLTA
jgi:hypothetical protein